MRDSENIGSSMPDPMQFYEVAKEILANNQEDEEDEPFDFSGFRFDSDEDEQPQEPGQPEEENGDAQVPEGHSKRF
jgi:hypothetical protein